MRRRIHSSISLEGLLTWDNRDLRGMLNAFDFDGKRASTVRDLRSRLLALVVKGTLYLPMGEPCEGWDPAKGCPGHDVGEAP